MAFATLEDLEDSIDLVVFPEAFSRLGEALTTDEIAVCDGRLSLRNGRTSIQLEQIMSIERARETFSGSVNLLIGREDLSEVRLEALKNVLQQHRGRGAFHLHVRLGKDRRTVIRTRRMTVLPSEHLISEIVALTGGRAWVSAENGEIRNARNGEAA
jgi:DNA polymerase-3 subunit alpha